VDALTWRVLWAQNSTGKDRLVQSRASKKQEMDRGKQGRIVVTKKPQKLTKAEAQTAAAAIERAKWQKSKDESMGCTIL
jgi:hypothetical protein